MISDTLSDAIQEIKRYQKEYDYDRAYKKLKPEINKVIKIMQALQFKLDKPPSEATLKKWRTDLAKRNKRR